PPGRPGPGRREVVKIHVGRPRGEHQKDPLESFSGTDCEKNALKILANSGNTGLTPNLV
ncbi:unnamed protein product, partial [Gulo gulo]